MQEANRKALVDDLQRVDHVGPSTAEKLVDELEIRDVDDLVRAAEDDWLRTLKGIGEARQDDILESARELTDGPEPVEEEAAAEADEAPERDVNVKPLDRTPERARKQDTTTRPETTGVGGAAGTAGTASESNDDAERTTPRPRSDRFIDRLRCPACGHDEFDRTPSSLTCTACRREYEVRTGITDLAPPDARTGGILQRVMESSIYARLYEKLARPYMTQIVSSRTIEEEKQLAASMLELGEDSTVLDVACGTGAFARYFAEEIAASMSGYDDSSLIVGMDISWPMLERGLGYLRRDGLNDRIFLIRGNAKRAPIGRSSFNRLHCGWALHLMDDIDEVMRSFARIVEPGGLCVLSTFLSHGNLVKRTLKKLSGLPGFKWFDRRELHDRLERVGFTVVDENVSRESITLKARRA